MVKQALRAGVTPLFDDPRALTANAAKRAFAERKLAAARLALEELEADEREAEASVAKAGEAVRSAITGLMADEANAIAVEVEELEAAAAKGHKVEILWMRSGKVSPLAVRWKCSVHPAFK